MTVERAPQQREGGSAAGAVHAGLLATLAQRAARAAHAPGVSNLQWHADTLDVGMHAAWDAVWMQGDRVGHGVTPVARGVGWVLALCLDCPHFQ